jgi:hypothetical protein
VLVFYFTFANATYVLLYCWLQCSTNEGIILVGLVLHTSDSWSMHDQTLHTILFICLDPKCTTLRGTAISLIKLLYIKFTASTVTSMLHALFNDNLTNDECAVCIYKLCKTIIKTNWTTVQATLRSLSCKCNNMFDAYLLTHVQCGHLLILLHANSWLVEDPSCTCSPNAKFKWTWINRTNAPVTSSTMLASNVQKESAALVLPALTSTCHRMHSTGWHSFRAQFCGLQQTGSKWQAR